VGALEGALAGAPVPDGAAVAELCSASLLGARVPASSSRAPSAVRVRPGVEPLAESPGCAGSALAASWSAAPSRAVFVASAASAASRASPVAGGRVGSGGCAVPGVGRSSRPAESPGVALLPPDGASARVAVDDDGGAPSESAPPSAVLVGGALAGADARDDCACAAGAASTTPTASASRTEDTR
jgi:hypothetical protein